MNTEVLHLRAHARDTAHSAALRLLATGWLARLQTQAHGLPHDAIVLVRRLQTQPDAGPGPRDQAWLNAADKAWSSTLADASRLQPGQAVPAAASAVWFADRAELLVNLLHDLAQGRLAQAWWWPLALGRGRAVGGLTDAAWQLLHGHVRLLPMAMQQLPPAQARAAWASGSVVQQQALLQLLVQQFGVHAAWVEPAQAPDPSRAGAPDATTTDFVALCRQLANDPTPLRRPPAASGASTASEWLPPLETGRQSAGGVASSADRRHEAAAPVDLPRAAATSAAPGRDRSSQPVQARQTKPEKPSLAIDKASPAHVDQPRPVPESAAPTPVSPAAERSDRPSARTDAATPGAGSTPMPARSRRALLPSPVPGDLQHPAPAAQDWPAPAASCHLHSPRAGLLLLLNAALAMGLYGDFSQPGLPGLALHPWHWLWLAARELHGPAMSDDPLAQWLHVAGGQDSVPDQAGAAWRPDAATLKPWSSDSRPWLLLHSPQRRAVVLRHPAGFTVARLDGVDELPALWTQLEMPPPPLLLRPRTRLHRPRDPLHDLWPCLWARLTLALHGHAPPAASAKAKARWATAQAGRVEISSSRVRAVFTLGQWPLALRLAGLDRNPGWIPAAGCELVFDFD